MKKNRKLKGILSAILLLMLISITLIANAYGPITDEERYTPGKVIDSRGNDVDVIPGNRFSTIRGISFKYESSGGGIYYTALYQPNIWCIENGIEIAGMTTYEIGPQYTVRDPGVAYILSKGGEKPSTGSGSYWDEKPAQAALWKYLVDFSDSLSTSDPNLITNRGIKDPTTAEGEYRWNAEADSIYREAIEYKNSVNSFRKPTVSASTSGNNLVVNIDASGSEKYEVYANGRLIGTYTDEGGTKTYSIDSLAKNGNGTVNVEIRAYINTITAVYNTCTDVNYDWQRLIISNIDRKQVCETTSVNVDLNVNVSMQKYIVKVTDTNKNIKYSSNARANKGTEGEGTPVKNYRNQISSSLKASDDRYKNTNPVEIDNGDYVTYRIYVYNNGSTTAKNVTVTDYLPQQYINANETITSKGSCDSISSGKGGVATANITTLEPGEIRYFEITVKFEKYTVNKVWNTAKVSTILTNETSYRTEDGDSIIMKKYEVSLEKYISRVGSVGNQEELNKYPNLKKYLSDKADKSSLLDKFKKDINGDGKIDQTDLNILNEYINLNYEKVKFLKDNLSEENRKILANDYLKADVNGDGEVNSVDLELFKLITNGNVSLTDSNLLEQINKYIKYDLNEDGQLNALDVNYYKLSKLNVNKDQKVNSADRYAIILLSMDLNKDGSINENDLTLLKKYLLNNSGYNVQNYIKLDLNGDGIVDEKDLKIYKELNSTIIKNINAAMTDAKIVSYSEYLKKIVNEDFDYYDINKDGIVNGDDHSILTRYLVEDYKAYKGKTISKLKEIQEELISKLKEEKDELKRQEYFNGLMDVSEYMFLINEDGSIKKEYIYDGADDIDTRILIRFLKWMNNNDFNTKDSQNNVVDSTDIGFLKILAYGNVNNYESNYNIYKDLKNCCDLNNDNAIDDADINIFNDSNVKLAVNAGEYLPTNSRELKVLLNYVINNLTNNDLFENAKDNVDLNLDGKVNIYDYNLWKQYYSDLFKSDSDGMTDCELDENIDTNKIKLLGDEADWLNNLNNLRNLNLDFNNDGKVTAEDKVVLQKYLTDGKINVSKDLTEAFINNIISWDVDGDNSFTVKDSFIYKYFDFDKLDINGDGYINEIDSQIYSEIISIVANKVSNEKVIKIIESTAADYSSRAGKAEYLTEINNKYVDNTKNDTKLTQHNYYKYNDVVTVSNGDWVTYTIVVKNDSSKNSVRITKVTDILPSGISAYEVYDSKGQKINNINVLEKTTEYTKIDINLESIRYGMLVPGESTKLTVRVKVSEPNLSVRVLKNTARISGLQNSNNADVEDSTPYNNEDSDYFQMKDIEISGTIWNDRSFGKGADDYDGKYNETLENKLTGKDVKVMLCRKDDNKVFTNTSHEGTYTFVGGESAFVKGPKVQGTNRWAGSYYSYYVVFEYDGIKYTPTTFKDITSNDSLDSNAKEDGQRVKETRTSFNSRFTTINNASGIKYETINEQNYIPQSKHVYDSDRMGIQASTNLISLSNSTGLEEQLKHVNLGLRGRDIFDLELMSDIYSTKITVNGQEGEYQYGNNIVTVRRSDIKAQNGKNITEDSANTRSEMRSGLDKISQDVRRTDIQNEAYEGTGLGIEVTYKFTITNASATRGTATKIADYYDDRYTYVKAYDENGNNLNVTSSGTYNGFNMVEIATNRKMLNQNDTMDIYVVYNLNEAPKTLEGLLNGTVEIPTYNIAEIVEYTTDNSTLAASQTQYTRGLIDKDSAPGSANREQVRLDTTVGENTSTISGNPTTVQYYFNKKLDENKDNDQYLMRLKYEDDTYTSPILYFVSSDNQRTITGKVFRDETTTNPTTKVKTGNGKIDNGEVGVYGATVRLFEYVNGGAVVRYTVNTDKDGNFTIKGFLPGNYYIRYYYGATKDTALLNQGGDGINKYSYNGEDYQSTNNTGEYGAAKLNDSELVWYVYNEQEGISTATDNSAQRAVVSKNVTGFIDEEMQVLNNMRDGKSVDDSKVTYALNNENKTVTPDNIMDKTWMYSDTNQILFTVEKSSLNDNREVVQPSEFGEYNVVNMNFGIAEVPVTTIDLQKHVKSFTITDSTGQNILASMEQVDGQWALKGDVIAVPGGSTNIDVSIENEKLQGARLEVTYEITSTMKTEKNFDNKSLTVPTIKGIVDYINNNLVYNQALGDNSKYWELTTYEDIKKTYEAQQWKDGTKPQGTADREGTTYTTIVKAKDDNPLLLKTEGTGSATITLEKVLTSTSSTIEQIIMSTTDTFEYNNIVEITGLDYSNVTPGDGDDTDSEPQRDRIRTPERYIIIPGVHHDTKTSETIIVHPPTGENNGIVYLVIAVISLGILAGGVFAIRKFVLKK